MAEWHEVSVDVPQPQGKEVADWYRDESRTFSEALHLMAQLKAQRDALLESAIWAERALAPFSKEPQEKSGISKLRAAIAKARGQS